MGDGAQADPSGRTAGLGACAGNTITTFAAALAAYCYHIPVGHIEATCARERSMIPSPKKSLAAARLTFRIIISLTELRGKTCSWKASPADYIGHWKHGYRRSATHTEAR